jgi:hypothetical protein
MKEQPEIVSWKYIDLTIKRVDDLAELRERFFIEKMKDANDKYQIQFSAAKEALGIALVAQEKATGNALEGTKEAINKADVATDKRFELLSDQIRALAETLNTNKGAQGIYVTHSDLAIVVEKIQTSFEDILKPLVSQVNNLTTAQSNQQGKSSGANALWGYAVGAVGLASTVILLGLRISGH